MSRKLVRCAAVASERRHDHASGTLMVRPSVNIAVIWSSETCTDLMRGSGAVAVSVPRIPNRLDVLLYESPYAVQFSRRESAIRSERQRLDPTFAALVISLDVNVHRPRCNRNCRSRFLILRPCHNVRSRLAKGREDAHETHGESAVPVETTTGGVNGCEEMDGSAWRSDQALARVD